MLWYKEYYTTEWLKEYCIPSTIQIDLQVYNYLEIVLDTIKLFKNIASQSSIESGNTKAIILKKSHKYIAEKLKK